MRGLKAVSPYSTIALPFSCGSNILALGAESNSNFAVLIKNTAYMGGGFNNLREIDNFENYKKAIMERTRELECEPDIIACDLHPEYISTQYAEVLAAKENKNARKLRLFKIQHHHAHVAGCMAENGLRQKVIGAAFDGTGYGPDGNIWGGEFLTADYGSFKREAHFAYVPMPGGDMAAREPIRMAFSYIYKTYDGDISGRKIGVLKRIGRAKSALLAEMINKDINSPLTSSAGRLFDAVSSMLGIKRNVRYEGEAAVELEKIASAGSGDIYEFGIKKSGEGLILEFWPMIKQVIADLNKNRAAPLISRKFHNTVAESIKEIAVMIRKKTKLNDIVLSGGVFQNKILLQEAKNRLENCRFSVYTHSKTSCSDRHLALGQAAIAACLAGTKRAVTRLASSV